MALLAISTGQLHRRFLLARPAAVGNMATVEVYDANANLFLAQQTITAQMMAGRNAWTRISLPIAVTNQQNSLEFRLYWHGTANLNVAALRVR